mmetsp:Transcript_26090/g.45413  ORF Transcript_26090/g.45413 Transcript_26090/m.45413 type:complete len:307 (-) Transcript_26090:81-1001(-)
MKDPEVFGKRRKRSEAERNATKMMIITGCLTLAVLIFIPMWNSRYLWKDPVYTYFSGWWIPRGVFVCCLSIWIIGFLTINTFFVRVPFEAVTESAILSLATIFLTLIGVVLTLYAQPLEKQASEAYMELWSNCQFGVRTRPLYAVYQQLYVLRQDPDCLAKTSVEQCVSFKDYPYLKEAELLKAMEGKLQCSGFCYSPVDANSTFVPYPPTLFSKDNYKVSCEGAAARHVRFFVSASASAFMHEGVFLILVAVAVGLLKLVSQCRSPPQAPGTQERTIYADDIPDKRVIYQEDPRLFERRSAYGAL